MGAIFYAVHSMIVMSGLYLVAGVMARRAGTFDLRGLGGHYAASPWFAAGFLLLAFSVAGLPPLSGFWPKLVLVREALADGEGWLAASILLTGLLTTLAIFRVWSFVFWRGGAEGVRDGAENWKLQRFAGRPAIVAYGACAVLVVLTAAIGLHPEPLARTAVAAANGLSQPAAYIGSVFGGGQ